MPAAAVKREGRALFKMIRRKGSVGCILNYISKINLYVNININKIILELFSEKQNFIIKDKI